ncbi:MAG: hypothetical protein OXG05_00305 [Gammaproteobacteria bacterium]|nr:hypothetical protein [Gammaproteobacteria bacterium]
MTNPALDLSVSRVIHASLAAVWRALKEPDLFVQWWAPVPFAPMSLKHKFRATGTRRAPTWGL